MKVGEEWPCWFCGCVNSAKDVSNKGSIQKRSHQYPESGEGPHLEAFHSPPNHFPSLFPSFLPSFLSFCWEHKQWPTQPLKNQVSPIPVLTEWLASTIGLYSTCCQDAVLQYQTTDLAESVLFASLTLYFRGQLRKSHSASVQRCTAVYWGGKVEGRKAENNPFKIHRDSCNLRTWWLLLSLRQSIDKQGLSDRGVGALEYCRRTVTLKLFVLHIFLIQ